MSFGYAIIDQELSSPSGSIDATQAFTDAYATGKPVYVPPGTYTVTSLAPPTLSQTIGVGSDHSIIRYAGTGTMCTLTNQQRTHFVDLRFTVTNAAATLFKVDNTFRASWMRCRFQGSHTAVGDAYATTSGHIGVWLTGNSGDNLFYDCDFLNLGIGLKTDCIQNAMIGGKFGSCYNGIYGFGGGGMALSGYVDFVGPFTPAIIVDKAINIDAATGQWWLDSVWIEGCNTGISVGTGSTGPTQFSMSNSKVASTTTCIAMNACRNPTIFGVQLAGDGGGVGTPDPLVIDATNAPEGTFFGESLIASKQVDTHLMPLGWTGATRVPGGTSTMRAPHELQFGFGSFLKMARSDGSLAPVLWVVGGPQLKIGAPGSNSTAVVRFQDTTPNVMMEIDSVLSSVNYPVIVPAVTGSAPAIIARGTDTNIDAKITPKGTGAVIAGGSGLTLPGFATGSLPTASAHTNTLAWDTTQAKPTYSDGTSWTAVGSGSSGVAAAPAPLTGNYFYPISSGSTTTNTMPNGFMYAVPFRVETAFTITRLGGDVTVIGDTGSKIRLGIYSDTGTYYPGTLLLDAGQIAGDSATRQEITISQALAVGWYWFVAVGQSIATTAPTFRQANAWTPGRPLALGSTIPAANTLASCYFAGSVTGALPGTFSSTVQISSRAPWLIAKAA